MASSQEDPFVRTAVSDPAVLRVGDAMRLLPMILLRHDTRVQRAYDPWHKRVVRYENGGQFSEAAVLQCLVDDVVEPRRAGHRPGGRAGLAWHKQVMTTRKPYAPVLVSRLKQASESLAGRFGGWKDGAAQQGQDDVAAVQALGRVH
jgi:hypothetical protein